MTRKLNVNPFAPSTNTSSSVGQDGHVSPKPRLTSQKADITRRTLEAACWFGLGCWDDNVANSHLSPGIFNSRVLHSCLVLIHSSLILSSTTPYKLWLDACVQRTIFVLVGIQSAELRYTVSITPCQGTWTSAPFSAHLSSSGKAPHLKSRHLYPLHRTTTQQVIWWEQQKSGGLGGSPMECGVVGKHYETPYFHHWHRHPPSWNGPAKNSAGLAKYLHSGVGRFRSCLHK